MALNGQIAQGTDDPALTNEVQTLNSLSLEKDQVAQQRAILFNAFAKRAFANAEPQALNTVVAGQATAATAFDATATPAEQASFSRVVTGRWSGRLWTSNSTSSAPAVWTSVRAP
jgi:nitrate/nitrite sensing protein